MTADRERLDGLWAALEVDEDETPAPSAHELNVQSIAALGSAVEARIAASWMQLGQVRGSTQARLRLFGGAVDDHSAPIKLAAKALVTFQDLLSSVAMAQQGKTSLRGTVPKQIRAATELRVFPRPSIGSVVFDLAGPPAPDISATLPGSGDDRNSVDAAVEELAGVLDAAGGEGPETDQAVLEVLKRLGPRVATHLRKLSALPLDDDLSLDVAWSEASGRRVSGRLGTVEATVLRRVINESKVSVEEESLAGVLVTLSSEDPLALRLHDGGRVPMALGEGLALEALTPYFNAPVLATVEVQVESHPTTGVDVRRYTLVGVEPGVAPPLSGTAASDFFDT